MKTDEQIKLVLAAQAALESAAATLAVLAQGLAKAKEELQPCRHENRVDVGTMSNLGAWYCPACGSQGNSSTVAPGEARKESHPCQT